MGLRLSYTSLTITTTKFSPCCCNHLSPLSLSQHARLKGLKGEWRAGGLLPLLSGKQRPPAGGQPVGQGQARGAGAEVKGNQHGLIVRLAQVGQNGRGGIKKAQATATQGGVLAAQGQQAAGEVVERMRVGALGGQVAGRVVGVHRQPRRPCGEPGLRAGVPLHGAATAIAPFVDGPILFAGRVEDFAAFEGNIAHTNFFALIQERRTAQGEQDGHGNFGHAVIFAAAIAAGGARQIVVAEHGGGPHPGCVEQGFAGFNALADVGWAPGVGKRLIREVETKGGV